MKILVLPTAAMDYDEGQLKWKRNLELSVASKVALKSKSRYHKNHVVNTDALLLPPQFEL